MNNLRKALLASAVTVLAFGAAPAMAVVSDTPAGTCSGNPDDCVTANAHASVSLVSTLSINEARAISFGDMAVTYVGASAVGGKTVTLGTDGSRTPGGAGTDTITLLHGANSTNGAGSADGGGPGTFGSGGQSPGHYTVTGGNEGVGVLGNGETTGTQVYISFADSSGQPVDFSGESYHVGNKVTLDGPGGNTFTLDKFVISCTGAASDVYGHYCDSTTQPLDITVGGTLHTVAGATYAAGKYVGLYNVMASY